MARHMLKTSRSEAQLQIFKGLRLPFTLVQRIERIAKAEGSTFSQFMRTAAIRELTSRTSKKSTAA